MSARCHGVTPNRLFSNGCQIMPYAGYTSVQLRVKEVKGGQRRIDREMSKFEDERWGKYLEGPCCGGFVLVCVSRRINFILVILRSLATFGNDVSMPPPPLGTAKGNSWWRICGHYSSLYQFDRNVGETSNLVYGLLIEVERSWTGFWGC